MPNWKHLFKSHILDRGYDYFCENAVEAFEINNDVIKAKVCGSQDYDVEISIDGDDIADMQCSCPYADSGDCCKHMAAVLFEYEAQDNKELSLKAKDDVEDVMKQANEEQVREFLSKILHSDSKLFLRFETFIRMSLKQEDIDIEQYKRRIDETVREYLGADNFISYYSAYYFIIDMLQFLREDVGMFLEAGNYIKAFELSAYLFTKVGSVDIDDSDGELSYFTDNCIQVWEQILEDGDASTEEAVFKWIAENIDSSINDYMQECLECIYVENFIDDKYTLAKLEYIKSKIEKSKNTDESWHSEYQTQKWIIRYIELMEKSKFSSKDIDKYCKENWIYQEVREYYIKKCIHNKNYEMAIKVLKESLQLDSGKFGLVTDYNIQLKDIYKIIGDEETYKQQLWFLVTKYPLDNISNYKELKALYAREEWENVREKIFAQIPPNAHIERLYKEEKLYDRLLKCVISVPGLYLVYEYENVLKTQYSKELIEKYAEEVNKLATNTADRKTYREWVNILRRMTKIKGGKQKAKEIADNWRSIYKNRHAMMDELSKL